MHTNVQITHKVHKMNKKCVKCAKMNQNVLKQFTQTSNVCKNIKKFHIASKNVKVKSKNYMHNMNELKKIKCTK